MTRLWHGRSSVGCAGCSGITATGWGRLNVPDPLPVVNGILAATAKVHGLTLTTRNVKDVARSGIQVLNPFEQRPV